MKKWRVTAHDSVITYYDIEVEAETADLAIEDAIFRRTKDDFEQFGPIENVWHVDEDSAREIRPGYWDEIPGYPSADWRAQVVNGSTRESYREWAKNEAEQDPEPIAHADLSPR